MPKPSTHPHSYGLHLPNLPKKDYLLLRERSKEWNMSMVQIVLLGLRGLEFLDDNVHARLTAQVVQDV